MAALAIAAGAVYHAGAARADAPPQAAETAPAEEAEEPPPEPLLFEVTAYTKDDSGMDGRGITSSGTKVKEWRTVAADPEVLPPGTEIYIPHFADAPNGGRFVVEDTGGAIRGRRLDVYMASRHEALRFGRRELDVHVLKGKEGGGQLN